MKRCTDRLQLPEFGDNPRSMTAICCQLEDGHAGPHRSVTPNIQVMGEPYADVSEELCDVRITWEHWGCCPIHGQNIEDKEASQ